MTSKYFELRLPPSDEVSKRVSTNEVIQAIRENICGSDRSNKYAAETNIEQVGHRVDETGNLRIYVKYDEAFRFSVIDAMTRARKSHKMLFYYSDIGSDEAETYRGTAADTPMDSGVSGEEISSANEMGA